MKEHRQEWLRRQELASAKVLVTRARALIDRARFMSGFFGRRDMEEIAEVLEGLVNELTRDSRMQALDELARISQEGGGYE